MDLKEARRLTGLTQVQLEDLAGLNRGIVADIERGKNQNPSHGTVTKIVRALHQKGLKGLTSEDLFPVEDESPKGPVASEVSR